VSAPITEDRLAEIEARASAATPGPWVGDSEFGFVSPRGATTAHIIASLDAEGVRDTGGADLAFIAHARTDVPDLVAEVESLRELARGATATALALTAERDALRAQLGPLCAVHDALVEAAALPGAGASPEAMVAAVREKGAAEGYALAHRFFADVMEVLTTAEGTTAVLGALVAHRRASRDGAEVSR